MRLPRTRGRSGDGREAHPGRRRGHDGARHRAGARRWRASRRALYDVDAGAVGEGARRSSREPRQGRREGQGRRRRRATPRCARLSRRPTTSTRRPRRRRPRHRGRAREARAQAEHLRRRSASRARRTRCSRRTPRRCRSTRSPTASGRARARRRDALLQPGAHHEAPRGRADGPDARRRRLETAQSTSACAWARPIVVKDSPGLRHRAASASRSASRRSACSRRASPAPEDIDKAMTLGYGHPMGPLELTDLVGLDVRLAIAEYLATSSRPRFEPPELLRAHGDAGAARQEERQGLLRLARGRLSRGRSGHRRPRPHPAAGDDQARGAGGVPQGLQGRRRRRGVLRRARRRCSTYMDRAGVARMVLINYEAPDVMGFTRATNDWVLALLPGGARPAAPVRGPEPALHEGHARASRERLVDGGRAAVQGARAAHAGRAQRLPRRAPRARATSTARPHGRRCP